MIRNISIIAVLAALIFGLTQYIRADYWKLSYTKEHAEYQAFIQKQKDIAAEQKAIENLKAEIAAKEQELRDGIHQAEILAYQVERDKLRSELNAQVNKSDSLLNAVRVWQNRTNSAGVPEISVNPEGCAETVRTCYDTIAGLTEAGQSCAIDYKYLYDSWQRNCEIMGCQ